MKKVLDVGQCGYDHSQIASLIRQAGAETVRAASKEEALSILSQNPNAYGVILINRIIDNDHSEGMDILKVIKSTQNLKNIPVMIISNYTATQDEAVKAGAIQGFGKNQFGDAKLIEYIAGILK